MRRRLARKLRRLALWLDPPVAHTYTLTKTNVQYIVPTTEGDA